MNNHWPNKFMTNYLVKVLCLILVLFVISCSGGGGSDLPGAGGDGSGEFASTGYRVAIRSDKSSIKSDNSDAATITVSVMNSDNTPEHGIVVAFASTGGQLSSSSAVTDENGQAVITFSSGIVDPTNQTVTITATASGSDPVQVPVQITGSTVTITSTSTSVATDGSLSAVLTVSVKDAGDVGVYNTPVTVTAGGTGSVSLSPTSGNTDTSGQLSVNVSGVSSGDVTVTAVALGTTATIELTVSAPWAAFQVTSPAEDPADLYTDSSLTVTVNAPSTTRVVFATTIGVWDGGTSSAKTVNVLNGTASAVLTSTSTGLANVQVYDANDSTITDSFQVAIAAPSSSATDLSLQSNVNTVAPSVGDAVNTATLTATVTKADGDTNQVVGGAPVAFSIVNPTGGGETISPVVVYTDSSGQASTTFASGSLSSGASGVQVKAEIIGTTISDTVDIVIGGSAGSVYFHYGSEIESSGDGTKYTLPFSAFVTDSNGNPVSGANITLSLWPIQYVTDGTHDGIYGEFANEDVDEDLFCDGCSTAAPYTVSGEDKNADGQLTPPNSAAGSVPATVTTDDTGNVSFDLIYPKASSRWIKVRLTGSTVVQGTETSYSEAFILPFSQDDYDNNFLPSSVWTAPTLGFSNEIGLSGAAGSTVSYTFTPTFGTGPYSFSFYGSGSGTLSASNGQFSTYQYQIPVGAGPGSYISDTIVITDSAIYPSSVYVYITVQVN